MFKKLFQNIKSIPLKKEQFKILFGAIWLILSCLLVFIGGFKSINEITLYYFFSTVSQTIGAIIGVLAAFTIFKIQRLEQDILSQTELFLEKVGRDMTFPTTNQNILYELFHLIKDDANNGNIKEMIEKTLNSSFIKTGEELFTGYKKEFKNFKNKYDYKKRIASGLERATGAGMFLIFLSLFNLMTVEVITALYYIKFLLLFLSMTLLFTTLFDIYTLIISLIKE